MALATLALLPLACRTAPPAHAVAPAEGALAPAAPAPAPDGWVEVRVAPTRDLERIVEAARDGTVLLLDSGTFELDGDAEINPPRNTRLTIRGRGPGVTVIRLTGPTTAFMIRTDSVSHFTLSDLSIVGDGHDSCDSLHFQSAFEMQSGV
ncbi:MAG TPA: hypothetical protein VFQ22_05145, partial [Longimicrobiales bacterium]|nr:hypothetical protein [Longimicrobiales bacterium]